MRIQKYQITKTDEVKEKKKNFFKKKSFIVRDLSTRTVNLCRVSKLF